MFYNHSGWDGNDVAAGAADDNAIAGDKTALLPGETATFANYTSYDKGINGLMIDVQHLRARRRQRTFSFAWGTATRLTAQIRIVRSMTGRSAPAPRRFTVPPGAGLDGADRVTLIWADGAIRNRWLQVTLRATEVTGLAATDVFYVGNAVGESGNAPGMRSSMRPMRSVAQQPTFATQSRSQDRCVRLQPRQAGQRLGPDPRQQSHKSAHCPATFWSSAAAGTCRWPRRRRRRGRNLEPEA